MGGRLSGGGGSATIDDGPRKPRSPSAHSQVEKGAHVAHCVRESAVQLIVAQKAACVRTLSRCVAQRQKAAQSTHRKTYGVVVKLPMLGGMVPLSRLFPRLLHRRVGRNEAG